MATPTHKITIHAQGTVSSVTQLGRDTRGTHRERVLLTIHAGAGTFIDGETVPVLITLERTQPPPAPPPQRPGFFTRLFRRRSS